MHDPMTVAFDIKWPWFWMKYRPSMITIWHVDPETDGSDDSCGWAYPKLTKKQNSTIGHLGYYEAQTPWFCRDPVKRISSPADAESLMRGAVQMVAFSLRVKMTWEEICILACRLTHNSADNFQGALCHLPGWHTNDDRENEEERKRCAAGVFRSIACVILQRKRPWYKHPRWHIHHWKIQVHCLQNFKRWAFSRCEACGKGFKWGECPTSSNWNGTGPLWFKTETGIRHGDCDGACAVEHKTP